MRSILHVAATAARQHDRRPRPSVCLERRVFAWRPIARYTQPTPYTERKGWFWLQPITERMTFFDGWRAYADENPGARTHADWLITIAATIVLVSFFGAAAVVVQAVTDLLG